MSDITQPPRRRPHPVQLLSIAFSTLMVAVILVLSGLSSPDLMGTGTTITVLAGALAMLTGVAFVLVTRRGRTTRPASPGQQDRTLA